jgi:broad specificity phosphatase PhoE
MLLYLVRHGETNANALGQIQGQLDTELSPLGKRQAKAVSERLAGEEIDAIVCSPLRRARDTAAAIAERLGLELIVDPTWMEINAGIFQGLDWNTIRERYPVEAASWKSHDPDFVIPQGESRRGLMERAMRALQTVRAMPYQRVLVVAHGGILSAGIKAILDIPARRNPFVLQNGSISQVNWQDDPRLITLNQTDHLSYDVTGGGDL